MPVVVHGEEAGKQQQGAEREGLRVVRVLVEGGAAQGEQGGEGAQEQGERAEQQRPGGGGEVLQAVAADESAARAGGKEVRAPGGRGAGQGERQDGREGHGPGVVRGAGGQGVGAARRDHPEESVAQEGVAEQADGPRARGGPRTPRARAGLGGEGTAAQGRADHEADGKESAEGHRQPDLAVGEAQSGQDGRAERPGQEGEQDPVGAEAGYAYGLVVRTRRAVAGHARVQLLGEREDVAVAEAGGGPVGDAERFESGGDLQRVHGPFAQVPVTVQQGLHGIGATAPGDGSPAPVGPGARPAPRSTRGHRGRGQRRCARGQ